MTLSRYRSGNTDVFHKIIVGTPKGKLIKLGIAFRTQDGPVGYLPFYGVNDFDFSGETSLKEELMARLPINLSAAGSPHTELIRAAASDLEFLGSGEPDITDIQSIVKRDLLSHAMVSASGVFIDGIMMALGGPAIKSLVNQFISSKVRQFIISKAITSTAKSHLKEKANFDAGRLLSNAP